LNVCHLSPTVAAAWQSTTTTDAPVDSIAAR